MYVLRGRGATAQCLVLRRAPPGRSPGSWETVHGTIEPGELPADAARRELAEETGLTPVHLYNASRVDSFYRHAADEIALIPVFAAFVVADAAVRLSAEHDAHEWLLPGEAARRFAWPRERRALRDIVSLFVKGEGGLLDDVLGVS